MTTRHLLFWSTYLPSKAIKQTGKARHFPPRVKRIIFEKNIYFLGFSRVVTLTSLLTALKETCSPNSLHIYCEQGARMQREQGTKPCNNFGKTEEVVAKV